MRWTDDPKRRQVALDAALPRQLNQDVLAVLVDDSEAPALFAWLKSMPFVSEHADGWVYHQVVRSQMLRHKHRTSPKEWTALHRRLADYYRRLQREQGLDEEQAPRNSTWQGYALDLLYHSLCQAPEQQLAHASNGFLSALKYKR